MKLNARHIFIALIFTFFMFVCHNYILLVNGQFTGFLQKQIPVKTGHGVWFYVLITPGLSTSTSGNAITMGTNRSIAIDYGTIPSTLGLVNLPVLGLLYTPIHHSNTFQITNKSSVPITITVNVSQISQPGSVGIDHLLYIIPDSQYISPSMRLPSYTFTLHPNQTETMHSVIVTGDLLTNVLSLLFFSPFPIGKYTGSVNLHVSFESKTDVISIPSTFTISN